MNGVVDGFLSMGIIEDKDENLVNELALIVEDYAESNIEQINVPRLFTDLMDVAKKYKFILPHDFVLMTKAIVTIEGVGQGLDPKFELGSSLHNYVDNLVSQRLKPSHIVKAFWNDIQNFKENITLVPKQVNEILFKLKRGDLGVHFERKDLVQLEREIDKSSNRLSMGIIIGALVIASAIVLQVRNGKWLAVAGFVIAIFLTINLIISVINERRIVV